MPAILANATNFKINSDYPQDKIIMLVSGSFTVAANGNNTQTIAHNLPFIPLPTGSWSTDVNWGLSYEIGTGPGNPNPLSSIFAQDTNMHVTLGGVTVQCFNNTASPITFYFRVMGFQPTTSADIVAATNKTGAFKFSSDYNYTKLLIADYRDQPASSGTQVISHNLGYRPQISVWMEVGGTVRPLLEADDAGSEYVQAQVTANSLALVFVSPPATRVHFRIWVDV